MFRTIAVSLLLVGFATGSTTAAEEAGGSPLETARQAEKGSLKSPYADFAKVAKEGHQKYMAAGCNGYGPRP